MEEEITFVEHIIKEGERFDTIATDAYGDPAYIHFLIKDNPHIQSQVLLPAGETLYVRIVKDPATGSAVPPWFSEFVEEEIPDSSNPDATIPVNDTPDIVPLAFALGFPKIFENNKIQFAVNKNISTTFSVEKISGEVAYQSPLYIFSSGFAVTTPVLAAGSYIVKVAGLISGILVIPQQITLAFTAQPYYYKDGDDDTIRYSVNKTGSYLVKVIKASDNSEVYSATLSHIVGELKTIAVPGTGDYILQVSTLSAAVSVYQACARGPLIYGNVNSATDTELVFGFDAEGVTRYAAWIADSEDVKLREITMVAQGSGTPEDIAASILPNPTTQFFTGNLHTVRYASLANETGLTFNIQGLSCSSGVDSKPITIESTTVAFAAGFPKLIDSSIHIQLNKAGVFNTSIYNTTTATSVVDADHTYAVGVSYIVPISTDGEYLIEVGSLTAELERDSAEPTGTLQVGGYFANGSFYVRAVSARPYSLEVSDFDGTVKFTLPNIYADEMLVPDNIRTALTAGLRAKVIDADGKVGYNRWSLFNLRDLSRHNLGYAVTNGDPNNHLQKQADGDSLGATFTGAMFEFNKFNTDADFAYYGSLPPLVVANALPSTPLNDFDRTVKGATTRSTAKITKAGLWFARVRQKLNNGGDKTQFFGLSDSQMRVDGTPVIRNTGTDDNLHTTPSLASETVLSFMEKGAYYFCKRNLYEILAGRMWCNLVITKSGEMEQEFDNVAGYSSTSEPVEGTNRTRGDFNTQVRDKFKTMFPEYSSISNETFNITVFNAARDTALFRRWHWFNGKLIQWAEKRVFDYVEAQIPELAGVRFWGVDVGSPSDQLSEFRHTQDIASRVKDPRIIFVKDNNSSDTNDDEIKYYIGYGSSNARNNGLFWIWEPSPGAPYTSHMNDLRYGIQLARQVGASISLYEQDNGFNANMLSQAGYVGGSLIGNKDEFVVVSGNKQVVRLNVPLSTMLAGFPAFTGRTLYTNERNSQGKAWIDFNVVDDIAP